MDSSPQPRTTALVLGLGTLVSHGFGLSLVPALLPAIERTFTSGFAALGVAVAGGLVAYATGGLAASKVLDRLPTRSVLNSTFALTGIALVLAAVAGSPALIAAPVILLGVSAPISWAATTHVAARSVHVRWRGIVMGGASGGVGLGVIVNGALVHFFSEADGWRTALLVAASLSIAVAIVSVLVFRAPISRPSAGSIPVRVRSSYREALTDWPGRVVVLGSAAAGVSSYTFTTFLTTTSVNTMGSSATAAGALLWVMGGLGVVASLFLGGLADRRPPILIVGWMFSVSAVALGLVAVSWTYGSLVVGVIGVAILNYPVWGLVAAVATNRYDPPRALAAVSLGLVGAALLSAMANVAAGIWLDRTGDIRLPVGALALLTLTVGVWLMRTHRAHGEDLSESVERRGA